MCLLQKCHRWEDLEVKVLALEKDHQLLEAENHSLASHNANQQKGKEEAEEKAGKVSVDLEHKGIILLCQFSQR